MSIQNYAELKTSIENFLDDADLTAYISDFITLAEAEIKSDLDLLETQAIATANLSTTSHYLALPNYFVSPIRIHINYQNEQYPIKFTTANGLNTYYTEVNKRPEYVALVDGQLEFNCIPDQTYETEFLFYQLTSIDDTTNTTNEVFPLYLNCYLYGALKHGSIFIKDDESVYARQYEQFINKIKKRDRRKRFPSPLRPRTRYTRRC